MEHGILFFGLDIASYAEGFLGPYRDFDGFWDVGLGAWIFWCSTGYWACDLGILLEHRICSFWYIL
jgi:hypothetical protein